MEKAADSEYQLMESGTWELVRLPSGRKLSRCRWMFKNKQESVGK